MQADSLGDDDDKKRLIREEAVAVANALRALKALSSTEARAKLQYFYDMTEGKPNTVRISHGKDPLNTWDPIWWVLSLTDLFYTGDFVVQTKVGGLRRWAKVLLSRVDYLGWSASKEFAVAAYNICQRRRQMWAVYKFVQSDKQFNQLAKDIHNLKAADFVDAVLQEGDFDCVKKALRKPNITQPVKSVLQSIQVALRDVEGSEAERETFRLKLGALRLWNGCSFIFFTLNPHDIKTPLLVAFISDYHTKVERVSLDWNDDDMAAYYERVKKDNPLRLHELACQWPAAAAACVHFAFNATTQTLFRCAPAANFKPKKQHIHTLPSLCAMPGLVSYVTGYLGVVEPQMRLTEQKHELIQVLGYENPRDFCSLG
jgi:hypothetical protein